MENALLEGDVVPQLWRAYKKTQEYKNGLTRAIPRNHRIVVEQEQSGLKRVYSQIVKELYESSNLREELKNRTAEYWIAEWKRMHGFLFEHVFRKRGFFRTKEVRFGSPGDEDLHRVPPPHMLANEVGSLATRIKEMLNTNADGINEKCQNLARIHYQFIRIHPFEDGNGRLARVITDQLALHYGLPPAMGGYPKHDLKKRSAYHKAIIA